jgi:hypothetical protein
MSMKITDISPYSLVEVDRRFRDAYCLRRLLVEAVLTSETLVFFNETTRRYIPEGCKLDTKFCFPSLFTN